jgi:glycosyltransferase involved in cell wall biosynthesis
VLADEERLIELGKQARKKAELAYNYKTVGQQYKELYKKILSS